jgi:two-component system, cell cycle sensor histidine kinase and response regulator CckA
MAGLLHVTRKIRSESGNVLLTISDIELLPECVRNNYLEKLGYFVHTVAGGEDAVEFIRNNSVDLLMLDMVMPPGIDGAETYRRVLKINPDQKAILVSGYSQTDRMKNALSLGAGAYIRKPLNMKSIARAVRNELDKIITSG